MDYSVKGELSVVNKITEGGMNIDVLALLKAFWRNILVILLVALICGAGAFAYTYFCIAPSYEATVTCYISTTSSYSIGGTSVSFSSGDLYLSQALTGPYFEILNSRTTLEEVIEEAGLTYDNGRPYSPDTLRGMIRTEASEDAGGIFRVTARSANAALSEKIANTIAKVLPDRVAEIIDGSTIRIVDYAIIPAARSSPSNTGNAAKGAFAGVILSCLVIFLLQLKNAGSDAPITSADDLRVLFPDIQILAVIPDMRRREKNGDRNVYSSAYNAGYYKSSHKGA